MYNMNDFYLLVSALQKSIRWCEVNESRDFARQLMEMGKPGAAINRLILIAAEDVGLADPTLLLYERQCSESFENLLKQNGIKKSEAAKYPMLCDIIDRAAIAAALSYKSRLLPMASFATLFDVYENEKFKENLQEYLNRFATAVKNGNEKQALYYGYVAGIFLQATDRILAWVQRQNGRRHDDLIKTWVGEYQRSDELLVFAGIIVMLCRDLAFTHGKYKDAINQYLSTPIKNAQIPDRAYDKHTRAGKKRGRGFEHFFNEAGSVKNERFSNNWEQAGRDAYMRANRKGIGKASKIIQAIKERL